MRRYVGPVLGVVLAGAVAAGIWYSNARLSASTARLPSAQSEAEKLVVVRGFVGSEKEAFFADSRVHAALAKHGLQVVVEKAGSRTIASAVDAQRFDFGFPSGAPAGTHLMALAKASQVFTPFYTPIVLASWRPIAEILEANGIASREGANYYITDLKKLIALMNRGQRWRDLAHSEKFPTNKALLVSSTDVRSSNSAAMYLALLSYEANGESIVQSQAEVDSVLPKLEGLFLRQGFQENSSASPFEDYLALGMGKTPLLVCYESQMVAFFMAHPNRLKPGDDQGDMVVMYPKPTVFSKHVLVPYNERGKRLGQVLETDPALHALAHDFGFRTGGEDTGPELWHQHGIDVPRVLVDVIDPPSHEWLERMISGIEGKFR
jgi:hypothetical protein